MGRLKIKPEHYRHIRDTIKANVNLGELRDAIFAESPRKYKDFGAKFRYDAMYNAGLSTWLCDNLYSYMDETHINSALKAIIKDLS